GHAHDAGRPPALVANKWGAVESPENGMEEFEATIRTQLQFLAYAPLVLLSAETTTRLQRCIRMVKLARACHTPRVPTHELHGVIMDAVAVNPTPTVKGRRLKLLYTTQVAVQPPTFVIFVNDTELVHFSFKRFIENRIREAFGYIGTPIHIYARKRS